MKDRRRRSYRLEQRTHPLTRATYLGIRTNTGPCVSFLTPRGIGKLRPQLDLVRHSPVGFDWGNTGSGSAQLALALLAHVSGCGRFALKHYQTFKHEIVAQLPTDGWSLTRRQILEALYRVCKNLNRPAINMIPVQSKSRKTAVIRALVPGVAEFSKPARVYGSRWIPIAFVRPWEL